jgi:hypothetical protein
MRASLNVALRGGSPLYDGEPETRVDASIFILDDYQFKCLYYAKLAVCEIQLSFRFGDVVITLAMDTPGMLKTWFEKELINWAILNNINVVKILTEFRNAWNPELGENHE